MYNIEEKIKSWLKNNTILPVTNQEDDANDSDKTKNESNEDYSHLGIEVLTDKELKDKATDNVKEKYEKQISDLKENLDLTTEKITNKNTAKILDIENKKEGVDSYYDNLNKKSVNDSVKQGISRSSILGGQIENNNQNRQKEYDNINNEINKVIKSNSQELDYYTKKFNNSATDIYSEMQKAVDEEFKKLKAEQDELIKNASSLISKEQLEKEENYQKLLNKHQGMTLDDIDMDYFNTLSMDEKTAIRQLVFPEILAYYYSLTPEEAKAKIKEDKETKKLLGSSFKVLERYIKNYN